MSFLNNNIFNLKNYKLNYSTLSHSISKNSKPLNTQKLTPSQYLRSLNLSPLRAQDLTLLKTQNLTPSKSQDHSTFLFSRAQELTHTQHSRTYILKH